MKKLKAVVIDDEELAVKGLSRLLIDLFTDTIEFAGSANNALEGIKVINKTNPDIVFLDVEMPGGSGFDMLEAIEHKSFATIFTTASSMHAIKAVKASAQDYLLKPIDPDELIAAIEKVKAKLQPQHNTATSAMDKLALPDIKGYVYVDIPDIIRIQADGRYSKIFRRSGQQHTVTKNILEYEEQLAAYHFFRCHKSHLINLHCVQQYLREGYVVMSDNANVEVSRNCKDELVKLLNNKA